MNVDFESDDGRAGQAEAEFEAIRAAGARRDGPALSSTTAPEAPEGREEWPAREEELSKSTFSHTAVPR